MLVLFFLLIFFITGIYFSKLKIIVKKLDFEKIENIKSKEDYEIKIGIYLFGKIKILGVTFEETNLRFLGISIPYENMRNSKMFKNMINVEDFEIDKKSLKKQVNSLDMKLEKFNMNLRFGTDSALITSFLTFAISTITSFLIQKSITKYEPDKHKFIITPMYENRISIKIFLELIASFKLRNIIKILYELNNLSKTEHIKHKIKFKEIKI